MSTETSEISSDLFSGDHKDILNKFLKKIENQLEDLSSISVITAVGPTEANINHESGTIKSLTDAKITILARTEIHFSGDIYMIFPPDKPGSKTHKINKEILDLHKENTAMAVQNWNAFVKTMVDVVNNLLDVAGSDKSISLSSQVT